MNEEHITLDEARRREKFWKAQNSSYRTPKLRPIDLGAWQNKPIPARQWIVDGWIPSGSVTMLGGDGGTGKTLLALQAATACAIGRDWLGVRTEPVKALAVCCEDDQHELVRRQADINAHYGVEFSDLENLQLVSRVGDDNLLMTPPNRTDDPVGSATEFFQQVHDMASDFGAQLVLIDSLHDVFGGNENARTEVRRFVNLLASLARDIDGAVLLTAHPSLSGRNSGTGESGSTAWGAAVRSRLYLTDAPDDDTRTRRILTRKKANYANRGEEISLTWREGVFVTEREPTGVLGAIHHRDTEEVVLAAVRNLLSKDIRLSEKARAQNFAPRRIVLSALNAGRKANDLERAMWRLIEEGRLRVIETGPASRRYSHLEPVEQEDRA